MSRLQSTSLRPSAARLLRWTLVLCATLGLAWLALDVDDAAVPAGVASAASALAPIEADPVRDPIARLGADVEPISAEAAQALGLAAGTALAVRQVLPGSEAARAGLQAQDVITAIAGPVGPGTAGTATTSASWEALCAALDERAAGGALDFFVRRDGRTRIVHVQLDALEAAARMVAELKELPQTACA
jgi:S1-C subfamily serine protease